MTINHCCKGLIAALSMLVLCGSAAAQISEGGMPLVPTTPKVQWNVDEISMPAFDEDAMRAEDDIDNTFKDKPFRFGKNFEVRVGIDNAGQWHTLPSGDRIWLLKLSSPGALSLNLTFDEFYLPDGAKLFIYTPDLSFVQGAYTSANNHPEQQFGTYPIAGDEIIVEYFEPASQAGNTLLNIATLTHAYRDLEQIARDIGDSGTCNNNVICPEGDNWRDEINSVAMIVVNGNGICTGALVNNTANDGEPYFLTANHCLGGSVATWVYRFNWQSTTCASNNAGSFDTVGGGTLLASGGSADYALLRINNGNPIPTSFNPYYAGWDATGVNPTNQTAIHHPRGDLKKISFDVNPAGSGTFGGATCWRIFNWEDGTTEPGSSGSPLFDQNKRIIGQLYGGEATCSNNVNDYYGKFNVTYPNVCQWLAPGCNTLVLDGYDPNAATVANDVQLQSVTAPSGTYCAASAPASITVRNAGTANLTSFTISYNTGGANSTQNWTGNLASGASTVVNLPNLSPGAGSYTFNVTLSNPNGTTDENPANNSGSSTFSIVPNGATVDFLLLTDNYPGETTWEILNASNVVVASDGPYAQTQTTFNYSFCLPEGCYTLNVFDSFGDGLQYQGVVGNYVLTDGNGTVLAQMVAGGNFGDQATHNFCVTGSGTPGCTNAGACNYDPAATVDNGSCEFTSCAGCTNAGACNYDPSATIDNGSCEFTSCAGCTDAGACNYNPAATLDNGSCEFTSCAGCTDSTACNYDGTATIDDGSCEFASCAPCLGDLNDDGMRNVTDILLMLSDFGCSGGLCNGDLDGDNQTAASDFLIILSLFGTSCN